MDDLEARIRISSRAKRISLVVKLDGICEVIIPAKKRIHQSEIGRFLIAHKDWIDRQRKRLLNRPIKMIQVSKKDDYLVREKTRVTVVGILKDLIDLHGFRVNAVSFRFYKGRWGSCTNDKKLQFHVCLSGLPDELIFYVVAHELCHTVHHHHKSTFWKLLSTVDFEWQTHRRQLRSYGCDRTT